jgi:hypothetical protein
MSNREELKKYLLEKENIEMFKNKILFKAYVGGDCNHPIFNTLFKTKFRFFSLPYIGAMAIATYGYLLSQRIRGFKC